MRTHLIPRVQIVRSQFDLDFSASIPATNGDCRRGEVVLTSAQLKEGISALEDAHVLGRDGEEVSCDIATWQFYNLLGSENLLGVRVYNILCQMGLVDESQDPVCAARGHCNETCVCDDKDARLGIEAYGRLILRDLEDGEA